MDDPTATDPPTPTRVVLYAYATGTAERAAEFRWSPDEGVTLTVIDPVEGVLAQQYHNEGIYDRAQNRLVRAVEGEAFMRALVQPSQSSYVQLVDESDPSPAATGGEPRDAAERFPHSEVVDEGIHARTHDNRYPTTTDRAVRVRPVMRGGAIVGYLWAAVDDGAAGFAAQAHAGVTGLEAAVAWVERLRWAKGIGLTPLQALRQWAGAAEDPVAGWVDTTEYESASLDVVLRAASQ